MSERSIENIVRLTLRQIEQFLAVAETMSYRRAAARLNMAQPPLTAAIQQIEDTIGARLFERTNRIVALTLAGQVLREEGARTLRQAAHMLDVTRRARDGTIGVLRLGFVASAVSPLIPRLVAELRGTRPDIALELTEGTTRAQVAGLLDNRLDLGLVVLPLAHRPDRRIATRVVLHSELVAALPAARFRLSGSLPLRQLAREPWVLFPEREGPGLFAHIMAACARAGFEPHCAQRAVQMETIVGLVAAGLGVALVPAHFRSVARDGVAFTPVSGPGAPVPYELALAWRADDANPLLAALLATGSARAASLRHSSRPMYFP